MVKNKIELIKTRSFSDRQIDSFSAEALNWARKLYKSRLQDTVISHFQVILTELKQASISDTTPISNNTAEFLNRNQSPIRVNNRFNIPEEPLPSTPSKKRKERPPSPTTGTPSKRIPVHV